MKTKASKAGKPTKYKKAPDAPKRFKSAFIIFSAEKHKEIKKTLLAEGRAVRVRKVKKLLLCFLGTEKAHDPPSPCLFQIFNSISFLALPSTDYRNCKNGVHELEGIEPRG